jgi:hypothetical protein
MKVGIRGARGVMKIIQWMLSKVQQGAENNPLYPPYFKGERKNSKS